MALLSGVRGLFAMVLMAQCTVCQCFLDLSLTGFNVGAAFGGIAYSMNQVHELYSRAQHNTRKEEIHQKFMGWCNAAYSNPPKDPAALERFSRMCIQYVNGLHMSPLSAVNPILIAPHALRILFVISSPPRQLGVKAFAKASANMCCGLDGFVASNLNHMKWCWWQSTVMMKLCMKIMMTTMGTSFGKRLTINRGEKRPKTRETRLLYEVRNEQHAVLFGKKLIPARHRRGYLWPDAWSMLKHKATPSWFFYPQKITKDWKVSPPCLATDRGLQRPEPLAHARITRFGSQVQFSTRWAPALCSNHIPKMCRIPIQNSSPDGHNRQWYTITGWWCGTSISFSHILGIIIPID